jgi:hypothetical protein
MVFAFALAIPEAALPASFLIFSFVGTGASFLAFAIFAAKRGLGEPAPSGFGPGVKGFYYLGGITEGTETILLFVFICLARTGSRSRPIFGALCWSHDGGQDRRGDQDARPLTDSRGHRRT